MSQSSRPPVYFISHGSPSIMFDTDHQAVSELRKIGKEITQKIKPRAIVVFSAHWEPVRVEGMSDNLVQVSTGPIPNHDLIYDYTGFPRKYYEVEFPWKTSEEVSGKVIAALNRAGFKPEGIKRGLDHGVFAPFVLMFDPQTNPLDIPIVEVSLLPDRLGEETAPMHIALGAALEALRDENILILCSGMAVHNLLDIFRAMKTGEQKPYANIFDQELENALVGDVEGRNERLKNLLNHETARIAHPSVEHLMPVYIAAGAAGKDPSEKIFSLLETSTSWAQYRFGKVSA